MALKGSLGDSKTPKHDSLKTDNQKWIRRAVWAILFIYPIVFLLIGPVINRGHKPVAHIFVFNSVFITVMTIILRMASNDFQRSDDLAWKKLAHHIIWLYKWLPVLIVISWLTLFIPGEWTWRSLAAALVAHFSIKGLYACKSRGKSVKI